MNIVEPFIRRPIMTTLVMTAILLFGILGYRTLAVSDLPNVDFPTIQVSAGLPGANPDTMAAAVATPLEKQFSTIAGIDSMTSTSTLGSTQVTLQFELSRNIDGAAQDVQAAIARAEGQLPPNMPTPPTFQKVNPADQPIYFLALTSTTQPIYTVDQYAETILGQRISMLPGRGAGTGIRGAEIRCANSARSESAGGAADRDRRGNRGGPERKRQSADGHAVWRAQSVHGAGQRTTDARVALQTAHRRLPQRLAGAARRTRERVRQRAGRQNLELLQRRARRHPGHPAAARDEHGRSGERGQTDSAAIRGHSAPFHQDGRDLRPFRGHSGVGERRKSTRFSLRSASSSW